MAATAALALAEFPRNSEHSKERIMMDMAKAELRDSLIKAQEAHLAWKAQLWKAVESGQCDLLPKNIQLEDQCELGRILNGISPSELKTQSRYLSIRYLHAAFHILVAEILNCAFKGKNREECLTLLSEGSLYSKASSALILGLRAWEEDLE
ncbi:MAG: CZB domain-containing protein [Elusimicrobiota bacterium]